MFRRQQAEGMAELVIAFAPAAMRTVRSASAPGAPP
jgi:hypothetical protein